MMNPYKHGWSETSFLISAFLLACICTEIFCNYNKSEERSGGEDLTIFQVQTWEVHNINPTLYGDGQSRKKPENYKNTKHLTGRSQG